MRMTSTGAFPRALAAARPPKPPPTMTTRGLCGFGCCPFELRVESLIYFFLKLLSPEISENLRDFAPTRAIPRLVGRSFFAGRRRHRNNGFFGHIQLDVRRSRQISVPDA